jgi:2,5-diamino-6-(ribosylamino)-4(3H)-pyrimidinone 5'-phosphate reductase
MKGNKKSTVKVIMHNEISLDGAIRSFEPNLELYYQIAETFKADVHLVGSRTAKMGLKTYWGRIPEEEPEDFTKPLIKSWDKRPYWFIPDTRGLLKGLLHVYRKSGYCKDVVVLVSKRTPKSYIKYLKERDYDHYSCGRDHVEFRQALRLMRAHYGTRVVMTDSGGTLNNILLKQGLISEISLLVAPVLVGDKRTNLFRTLKLQGNKPRLQLIKNRMLEKHYLLLIYRILQ